MSNNVDNRIELIGSESDVKEIIKRYSTFHPTQPQKRGDSWLYVNGKEKYGWLNEKTNLFSTDRERDLETIPEGFKHVIQEEYWEFPDFAKVHPVPDELSAIDNYEQDKYSLVREWKEENWGGNTIADYFLKESETIFQFTTFNTDVPGIINKMSQDFPNVTIIYESIDIAIAFGGGKYIYRNGILCYQNYGLGSKDGYEIAFKIYPEMREEYVWKDGRYEEKK